MFGWGKKKDTGPPEGEGFLGELSENQEQVLAKFKEWIAANKITENPWFIDTFLLRFCRARKFDLPKVIEMFSNYMKYREENGLDDIIYGYNFEYAEKLAPYYPRGYCGVDKAGRPIYIERSGLINADKVMEIITEEEMMKGYYQSYEVLQK